jgi:cell division protein FtsB
MNWEMFLQILGTVIGILALVSPWVLYSSKKASDKLAALEAQIIKNDKEVVSLKAEMVNMRQDIKDVKSDLHSVSSAVLSSINRLDERFHSFIVAQVKGAKND